MVISSLPSLHRVDGTTQVVDLALCLLLAQTDHGQHRIKQENRQQVQPQRSAPVGGERAGLAEKYGLRVYRSPPADRKIDDRYVSERKDGVNGGERSALCGLFERLPQNQIPSVKNPADQR